MDWTVELTSKAKKQAEKLPKKIVAALIQLMMDIRKSGPIRGDWPNYSKLSEERHHCHLKKGHPTYVAVWREESNQIKLVEVIYVGTHEKAPY
ncbi:MAG: hypothetical protein WC799_02750 [Desulfobacteraceae bacterium]|jgi:mRNA-degrading endonuclease RelE of RelBE toxin-antitoxin system